MGYVVLNSIFMLFRTTRIRISNLICRQTASALHIGITVHTDSISVGHFRITQCGLHSINISYNMLLL